MGDHSLPIDSLRRVYKLFWADSGATAEYLREDLTTALRPGLSRVTVTDS